MKLLSVPEVDIAPFAGGNLSEKRTVAQQVDRACRDIGFLIIKGHGVSPSLMMRMKEVSREFFDLRGYIGSTRNHWHAPATATTTPAI
jgi:isopenicillin N synthase-like dioxygenase